MRLKLCILLIFPLFVTGCMTPSSNLNETLINSGALLEKDYLKFLASAAISSPGGSIVLTNPTINQIPNNSASSLLENPGSFNVGSLTFFGSSNPSDIYISDRQNVPGCDIRASAKFCKYDPVHVVSEATVTADASKYSCVTTIYDNVYFLQIGTVCQLIRR